MDGKKLDYYEAITSPCEVCTSCQCCTLYQLDRINVNTLMELDTINYYLNFDNIAVCLSTGGEWTIYYNYPCRFFDTGQSSCALHGTPRKPGICVNYNPYFCYYKKVKKNNEGASGIMWINRERMDYIMSRAVFDEDRNLILSPSEREKLYGEALRIPYQEPGPVVAPVEDSGVMAWKQSVLSGTPVPDRGVKKSHLDFLEPCGGCEAYCCQCLIFPQQIPGTYSSLDYIGYALGFPGVELGISDSRWFIIVKTKCRFLDGGRCSLHEKPGKPLTCKYYNAVQCFHKSCLSEPRPKGFMRIGFEEFKGLMETFKFDDVGNITAGNNIDFYRAYVESGWLKAPGKSAPQPQTPQVPVVPAALSLSRMIDSNLGTNLEAVSANV